ncbi:MAG: DUF4012 domain-containing protein, partial [Propionibacteriaceae bacterium]|nr:DUF4012 domain-containing protein [Propionibacteriaceae bacterium]
MKRRGVWIAAAVAAVVLILLGVWGFSQAKQFEALAKAGKADASAGLKSLAAEDPAAALASFQKATDEFGRARALLGPEWLHGVPWVGRQLAAADDLATIGMEGSSAGAEAVQVLEAAGATSGEGGLNQLLVQARPHLDSALASLVVVAERSDGLTTDGLVPQLADAVTELNGLLDPMRLVLSRSQAMLELERYLFSGEHTFLMVAQNSSELRPTGGFMGTFGMFRFGPGGIALDSFADVYSLPFDTLDEPLPEGGQVNYNHFYFRNTNWWMDFPTSTHMMLKFWANLKQPELDGIIAVDIPLLQALLRVHGPITVPESSEPITAQNAMLLLNEVVQYDKSGQASRDDRKLAIVSLVKELFGWLTGLPADQARPVLDALVGAANQKHVQVYFTDPAAQAAIVQTGWSGALAPPEGTTDLVAVSNGVIIPSKANFGVSKTLDYVVVLNPDGSADTTLALGYTKSPQKLLGVPQQWLANYTRVHRLAGTTSAGEAVDGFTSLVDATGLPTFGQYFRLNPGASKDVTLQSRVPEAVQQGAAATIPGAPEAASTATGDVWHYRLLLAKQADLVETGATVTVTVPEGWAVAGS